MFRGRYLLGEKHGVPICAVARVRRSAYGDCVALILLLLGVRRAVGKRHARLVDHPHLAVPEWSKSGAFSKPYVKKETKREKVSDCKVRHARPAHGRQKFVRTEQKGIQHNGMTEEIYLEQCWHVPDVSFLKK